MFEKEIKFLSDFNFNKLQNVGNYIEFSKLGSAGIHGSILNFINAELNFLIYKDRKSILDKSIFDYSGNKIANLFNSISEEIIANKRINIDDVKKLFVQSISFNINFLTRPNWSLEKLIFQKNETISADELKYYLKYVYYYEHIPAIISSFLNKKKLVSINSASFTEILRKIDEELLRTQSGEIIDNVLSSISDFVNQGGTQKSKLSLSYIEVYLKEKKLDDYIDKLRNNLPQDYKIKYDIKDIKKILFNPAPPFSNNKKTQNRNNSKTKNNKIKDVGDSIDDLKNSLDEIDDEIFDPAPEINSIIIPEEIKLPEVKDKLVNTVDAPEEKVESPEDSFKDILKQEMEYDYPSENLVDEEVNNEVDLDNNQIIAEKDNNVVIDSNIDTLNFADDETEIMDFSDFRQDNAAEDVKEEDKTKRSDIQVKLNDFLKQLSDKDMQKMTKKIFKGNYEDLVSTAEELISCPDYDKATEILKEVFFKYRVNPYTKDAIKLTNMVEDFFKQGE